jgi:hypothetical protein
MVIFLKTSKENNCNNYSKNKIIIKICFYIKTFGYKKNLIIINSLYASSRTTAIPNWLGNIGQMLYDMPIRDGLY